MGLVAPLQIGFGAVIAAGSTVRRDVAENQLVSGGSVQAGPLPYDPTIYRELLSKLMTTAKIAFNLRALLLWYSSVRLAYADGDERPPLEGAMTRLEDHLQHRTAELNKVLEKVGAAGQHPAITRVRREIGDLLLESISAEDATAPRDFLSAYETARKDQHHIDAIRSLSDEAAASASVWLTQTIQARLERLRGLLGVLE